MGWLYRTRVYDGPTRDCIQGNPRVCSKLILYTKLTDENDFFSSRMTLTWREREHSAVDNEVMNNDEALEALRGCGLLKFFKLPNMKANVRLLERLIDYWDVEEEAFMIDQMPLRIEVEDIYFIKGLSRRGEVVHSRGRTRNSLSVDDYVHIYCPGHRKVGSQISIPTVESLSLRIILFTIARVNGSSSLHQASRVNMSVAVDCLTTVFDWCTPLLSNMKEQLASIRRGQTKNFGYGTILCTFFFEKVPALRPRVAVPISSPRDPRMGRWADLMKRLGGGEVPRNAFDDDFFAWWEQQIIAIDDYPYAGLDFRGDPDLVLPPDAAWGEIGKIIMIFYDFYDFSSIMMNVEKHFFFYEIQMTNMMIMFQTLGLCDHMGSRGMDGVAEEPKRRLRMRKGLSTTSSDTWRD